MVEPIARGEVWLVGAGPGDPRLLTRKAERLPGEASVVFREAPVAPGVLALANPRARLVPVGTRSGRHSKDQKTIDALIVAAARRRAARRGVGGERQRAAAGGYC
jgi:uroporphyrin-III C-methyltransferase